MWLLSDESTQQFPIEITEAINRIVRASRTMPKKTGREPIPDEPAERVYGGEKIGHWSGGVMLLWAA